MKINTPSFAPFNSFTYRAWIGIFDLFLVYSDVLMIHKLSLGFESVPPDYERNCAGCCILRPSAMRSCNLEHNTRTNKRVVARKFMYDEKKKCRCHRLSVGFSVCVPVTFASD